MNNIPSVEALAKDWLFGGYEPKEEDVRVYEDFKEFLTHTLTADRTALLTKLIDSGLLEEKDTSGFENDPLHAVKTNYIGHNDLARAIKAHLHELIKSTSV